VNLLSNAVKFAPADEGIVKLRLSAESGKCRVSVSDNGPGIPKADQPHIFEKFHQGSGGSDKPVGTGLGLPISRRIIEHFDGRIWVDSAPRNGATFTFELPMKRNSDQRVGKTDVEESPDSG
jgi:hypothetical protein